ncbi:MAG: rod shape-determining protein RodA [Bacteroidia bacterium]|jgi:rod shape determining protein RodA
MSTQDRRGGLLGQVDWVLIGIYLTLALIGWMHVWSAVPNQERVSPFDVSSEAGKQFAWLLICLLIGAALLLSDTNLFYAFRWPFFGIGVALLLLVLVIGQEVGGNKSWIVLNSFIKIQPSEFAKYFTALALAGYLSTPLHLSPPAGRWPILFWIFLAPITLILSITDILLGQGLQMKRVVYWLKAFAIIGIPAVLVLAEKDTGSTLVYAAFVLAMFRFGLYLLLLYLGIILAFLFLTSLLIQPWILVLGLVLVSIAIWLLILERSRKAILPMGFFLVLLSVFTFGGRWVFDNVLMPHQRTRIMVLFNPDLDPKGSGWNVNNSKMAIGSGSWFGKGFLNGTLTQLKFVPKQHTDFIFSAIGEQWGLLGTTVVILLFLTLMMRLILRAEMQRSPFAKAFGYIVACVLFFHFFMNIGTTIGLAPAVGVPLPFISYGGSSLLGFTLLLFTFIKLDAHNLEVLR